MKRVLGLSSRKLGMIMVGSKIDEAIALGIVSKITEYDGVSNKYPTHFIHFENNTKTLEILDVNYIIRDNE